MAACDVVVAPSVQEPLARTVLEAQCLGVPVIASTDGGLSEIIEDGRTGFLCEPHDVSSWVKRTRQLLDDKPLARSFAAAARDVVGRLTPERNAQDIERIYAKMLEPRRVRSEPIEVLP